MPAMQTVRRDIDPRNDNFYVQAISGARRQRKDPRVVLERLGEGDLQGVKITGIPMHIFGTENCRGYEKMQKRILADQTDPRNREARVNYAIAQGIRVEA